jgi:hypothetical protein
VQRVENRFLVSEVQGSEVQGLEVQGSEVQGSEVQGRHCGQFDRKKT